MAHAAEGKLHIITRGMGIVLAAQTPQYWLDGVTGYDQSVSGRWQSTSLGAD
jgi:hypothetical protein